MARGSEWSVRSRRRISSSRSLRRAFTDWVRRIAERLVPGGEKLAAEMTLEDMRMTVVERVSEWPKQWVREGRKQGMREGIARGIEQGRAEERALLERMAASRFGTDTAERLSAVLVDIADPERLVEVGEWLVRCETAEEFLSRAESARGAGEGRWLWNPIPTSEPVMAGSGDVLNIYVRSPNFRKSSTAPTVGGSYRTTCLAASSDTVRLINLRHSFYSRQNLPDREPLSVASLTMYRYPAQPRMSGLTK